MTTQLSADILPLFSIFDETSLKNDGLVETNLLSLSYGRIVPKDIASREGLLPESYETYQIVEPGQIILRLTDMQNDQKSFRTGLVRERGIITSAYCALRPKYTYVTYAEFFDYLFHSIDTSKRLYSLGGGVRQSLKFDDIKRMSIKIPKPAVRDRIVRFLDEETAKIDNLIKKQESLKDLYSERVVTARNQLLDDVQGEDIRLRWVFSPSAERAHGDEQVLSVYRDYGVIPKESRSDNHNVTPVDISNYRVVAPGDLVINKMKAWQGSLGISRYEGVVSGDYEVLHQTDTRFDSSFLHHFLRSRRMISQYAIRSKGIRPSQWRLYWDEFSEITIPLIPMEQQTGLVGLISEIELQDGLIEKCDRMVELLQERRSALITAAVAGQIEV